MNMLARIFLIINYHYDIQHYKDIIPKDFEVINLNEVFDYVSFSYTILQARKHGKQYALVYTPITRRDICVILYEIDERIRNLADIIGVY